MNIARRTALLAGLAAPLVVASPAMADFGSGALGGWTTYSRSISTPYTIAKAVSRDGIYLFGDSITRATARDLATLLYPDGITVAVNAWSARPTPPTVDALAEWVRLYGVPRRVVMASGSNDIFNPPVMAAQIDRTMAIVGRETTVLWVNVQVARISQTASVRLADQRNSGWINMQIAAATARHPNLRIVDWAGFLAAKPFRLTAYLSDGVHTTTTGGAARNALIRKHVLAAGA